MTTSAFQTAQALGTASETIATLSAQSSLLHDGITTTPRLSSFAKPSVSRRSDIPVSSIAAVKDSGVVSLMSSEEVFFAQQPPAPAQPAPPSTILHDRKTIKPPVSTAAVVMRAPAQPELSLFEPSRKISSITASIPMPSSIRPSVSISTPVLPSTQPQEQQYQRQPKVIKVIDVSESEFEEAKMLAEQSDSNIVADLVSLTALSPPPQMHDDVFASFLQPSTIICTSSSIGIVDPSFAEQELDDNEMYGDFELTKEEKHEMDRPSSKKKKDKIRYKRPHGHRSVSPKLLLGPVVLRLEESIIQPSMVQEV